jgi:putative ABC transport system permease protein
MAKLMLMKRSYHSYLLAAVFVLIVSVFGSFMFSSKIKKLDMVGIFKGVE